MSLHVWHTQARSSERRCLYESISALHRLKYRHCHGTVTVQGNPSDLQPWNPLSDGDYSIEYIEVADRVMLLMYAEWELGVVHFCLSEGASH